MSISTILICIKCYLKVLFWQATNCYHSSMLGYPEQVEALLVARVPVGAQSTNPPPAASPQTTQPGLPQLDLMLIR